MAIGIENYPNIDTTDPTNYPDGTIKDDPTGVSGTPINVLTTQDIHQTFWRALFQVQETASGDPDNITNGYQYGKAFGLEAWRTGGTLTFTAVGGGIVTVDLADITRNRWHRVGNTMTYQLRLEGASISGTVTSIRITGTPLSSFYETTVQVNGYCNSSGTLVCVVGYSAGAGIQISPTSGLAFTTGTDDVDIDITIISEMLQVL